MDDEFSAKPTLENDEFHFNLEEDQASATSHVYQTIGSKKQNAFGQLNRTNLWIVAGAILVFFALFKLFTLFFSDSRQKEVSVPLTPPPAVTMPQVMPQPVVPSTSTPPVVPSMGTQPSAALENQVSGLQNQVTSLSSSVSDLKDNMSQIQAQLQMIQTQLQKSPAVQVEKKSVRPKVKHVTAHKKIKRTRYYQQVYYVLRAIIPNRAWVVDSWGNNYSVTRGDILPGVGRIRIIDPNRGRVITSRGTIIRYSN